MARQSTGIFNKEDDFQVPLMNVFRSAIRARDEKAADEAADESDRRVSTRQIERREGVGYDRLKDYFLADLENLMCTVQLEAVEDLEAYPHVRASVLNYGVIDVTNLTGEQAKHESVRKAFRQALLDHEPRLIPESLQIRTRNVEAGSHSVAFEVEAVLAARPVDVPLEFIAEIDVGNGRVHATDVVVSE